MSKLTEAIDRKEEHPHVMHILTARGDDVVTWDPTVDEEVARLSKLFDEQRANGMTMYSVKPGESGGEVLNRFDKEAEKIIATPQIRGG